MENRIAISTGTKVLEAQNGSITLPLGDQRFMLNYYEMADRMEEKLESYRQRLGELDEGDARGLLKLNVELHETYRDEINALFGEGTCYKVFGDIVPGTEMYMEFFRQIAPHFEKYNSERASIIKRYSAERKGDS